MKASSIPTKVPTIWAAAAGSSYVRTVPVPSQIGIQNGAASFTDGFPPLTFTQPASGGVPPFGQDTNGILQLVTAWLQWAQAGGPLTYDATFQTGIGGYPNGARVLSAAGYALWQSTVDNNTTDPDTGGAGWAAIYPGFSAQVAFSASSTWVVPAGITRARVRVWAAGGGGAGSTGTNAGGGGGAGGYAEMIVTGLVPGANHTVTVGTAGTAGISGGGNGGNGGNSSFDSTVVATGGSGGEGSGGSTPYAGGAGGIGTTGTILMTGGHGNGGGSPSMPMGGAAPNGGAGGAASNGEGSPGAFPGGGGAGWGANTTGAGQPGAGGLVIVEY